MLMKWIISHCVKNFRWKIRQGGIRMMRCLEDEKFGSWEFGKFGVWGLKYCLRFGRLSLCPPWFAVLLYSQNRTTADTANHSGHGEEALLRNIIINANY